MLNIMENIKKHTSSAIILNKFTNILRVPGKPLKAKKTLETFANLNGLSKAFKYRFSASRCSCFRS